MASNVDNFIESLTHRFSFDDGISSIAEIIETTTYTDVRSHGLEVIKRIKSKNKTAV